MSNRSLPLPLNVGRTLRTRQTEKWSAAEWAKNEEHERRRIFAHFSAVDEGRSRQPIAEVFPLPDQETAERYAEALVKAANLYPQAEALLRRCLKEPCGLHPDTSCVGAIRLRADIQAFLGEKSDA